MTLLNRGRTRPELFPEAERLIGDRDGDLSALAGRSFDAAFDFSAYFPRQVEATASRLAGAAGHYTFLSSCSVYADHSTPGTDESAPVAELSEPGSENLERDYGALKALCEQTAERLLPGQVLSVRAGLIVGPHDPTNRFTYWVTRLAEGGRVLAPEPREQPVQLVDARDLAAWMLTMAETGETGVYNAAGPADELTLGATLETIRAAVRAGCRARLGRRALPRRRGRRAVVGPAAVARSRCRSLVRGLPGRRRRSRDRGRPAVPSARRHGARHARLGTLGRGGRGEVRGTAGPGGPRPRPRRAAAGQLAERPGPPSLDSAGMASQAQISVGGVPVGGGAPVAVQSMTLTYTHDVDATMEQIGRLASAGCEIVRVAVPKTEDAEALKKLVYLSPLPIVADIHFNASLALKAVEAGVAKVRINPGNIGGLDKTAEVVKACKAKGIPMRIGANSGSLPKHLIALAQEDTAAALVEEALEQVRLLESLDYRDFAISVKSSSVPTMVRAYRMLSARVPYPLHLGVTEAGPPPSGVIKSSVGIGSLLMDGIGDTIRVSLTADPVREVETAWDILKSLGLRERGPVMIACPSCGRDNVGVEQLAETVAERLAAYPEAFEVAVMGCAVNGPGEAGDADFGIAGGRDVGFIYAHGRVLKKVSSEILIDELFTRDRHAGSPAACSARSA